MRRIGPALAAGLLGLAPCQAQEASDEARPACAAEVQARVTAAAVEIVRGRRSDLALRLVEVVRDERCPADRLCSWARPPLIRVEAASGGRRAVLMLDLSPGQPPTRLGDWALTGVDLAPAPLRFGRVLPLERYGARLRLEECPGPP